MASPRRPQDRFSRWLVSSLWPNQRLKWTREGLGYILVWAGLLWTGLYQQINLIMLVAGMAAGPVVASILASAAMLRRLTVSRRVPAYTFAGEPLNLDYSLENGRTFTAALALHLQDELIPVDRAVSGTTTVTPTVFFPRVGGGSRLRIRWQGIAPKRGKYLFRTLNLATRSPFGLLEREVAIQEEDQLTVYPTIGQLTRRWQIMHREASETKRGQRHDRAMDQQEYHGLRDYRPGDSPRWIHWRTSARLGIPMVKEFEQQHEQDLAILIDPWLPRNKVTPEQRERLEDAVRFAATVCYETCRHSGRRLVLGWTGAVPGIRQGPASVKLLHEMLEQLAVLKSNPEGTLSGLLDVLPPATLREAMLVIVSTRAINLLEEAERSSRLSGGGGRGILGRVTLLDASKGELDALIQYEGAQPLASGKKLARLDASPANGKPAESSQSAAVAEVRS